MAKDTYYFSHDYNAHNDIKILFLRQQLGMEGYGIFWFLVESLADSGGILPMKLIPVLAMQMQVTEAKVNGVITGYDLFKFTEENFYSERLITHLQMRKTLSENGKKGAVTRWNNGGAISHPNGTPNAKERKGKEKKVKEINKENNNLKEYSEIEKQNNLESNSTQKVLLENSNLFMKPKIPTLAQVEEKFIMCGGTKEMAKVFFDNNEATGWFYRGSAIVAFQNFVPNFINAWRKNESKNQKEYTPPPTPVRESYVPKEHWGKNVID